MDDSIKFYTEVLGMNLVDPREKLEPTKGEVVSLKSPDSEQILELNYYEKDSPFNSSYANGDDLDHLAFEVESLRETVEALKSRGIEIIVEPGSIGGWKEAFARDPNGIWIELLEKKSESQNDSGR
jgi:lactoylglutathione lyase